MIIGEGVYATTAFNGAKAIIVAVMANEIAIIIVIVFTFIVNAKVSACYISVY